jgi:large subunit ribosomal protein L22
MEAKAIAKHIRMSPRKVRLVVDLIRGKSVGEAISILQFSPKAAAEPVSKTLRSAVANATVKAQDKGEVLDVDDLIVSAIHVDPGPALHRFRRAAMGRAAPIMKRTSHITVVVDKRSN